MSASMTRQIASSSLSIWEGDLTTHDVDAIVNAANSSLLGGGGVDGAIHRAGGPAILDACKAIRRTTHPQGLPTGQAVLTTGGNLPARYVIHTVGPVYDRAGAQAPTLLRACVVNSLQCANEHQLQSIAFPAISTGVYGYPMAEAAQLMLEATIQQMNTYTFDEIRFVLFGQQAYEIFASSLASLTQT